MLRYVAISKQEVNGIAACDGEETISIIGDIAPIYEEVEILAEKLNSLEVSLIHFNDIIEDYIQQRAM